MSDRPNLMTHSHPTLDDMLAGVSFRSEVIYTGQLCDTWAINTAGSGKVSFHVVAHGQCWIHHAEVAAPCALVRGDVVLFPRDAQHVLASEKMAEPPFTSPFKSREAALGGPVVGVGLVCGLVSVDHLSQTTLLQSLPEILILRRHEPATKASRMLIRLMLTEATRRLPGSRVVLERMADALFFTVLRDYLGRDSLSLGVLSAMRDKKIGQALDMLCNRPLHDIHLDQLAARCAMSRSSFAAHFRARTGMTPMEFAIVWRMQRARRWLSQDGLSVVEVAERAGYLSEAAFAKAFKRVMGVGPGQARRQR